MSNATVSDARATASEAANKAGEVATTAREQAVAVAQQGQEEVRTVAREASTQAKRVVRESRHELRTEANAQASRVAQGLRQLSDQLHTMATSVDDGGPVVSLVDEAGEQTRRLADRLEGGGVDGVIADTRRFARNRPGLFLLGALGAGVAAGRLLKGVGEGVADLDAAESAAGAGGSSWDNGRSTYDDGIAGGYRGSAYPSITGTAATGTPSSAAALPTEADPAGDYSGNIGDPSAVEQAAMPIAGGMPGPWTEPDRPDRER